MAGLDIAAGVELQLFSSEPLMLSPTNIDVDWLGRVWVCEAVNYRHFRNADNPERTAGDRIVVLEDSDLDGRADKLTTFHQGTDIDSPHGICVLGKDVIVSAGANVYI
ncbi:MAG: dehydrogenase, partial [Pirellulaceae bacterium]